VQAPNGEGAEFGIDVAIEDDQGAAPSELEALRREVDALQVKAKSERDLALRYAADLDNFRKRALKDREETQRYALEKLLTDFFLVYDNFDRALDHARTPEDFDSFKKGVEMMRRLFEDTLAKHGARTFSAQGQLFDPARHEAMSMTETTEFPANQVLSEVLKGFTLHERVVRPALVVVARAPGEGSKDVVSGNTET
jgi:molecular chaperone GrpE